MNILFWVELLFCGRVVEGKLVKILKPWARQGFLLINSSKITKMLKKWSQRKFELVGRILNRSSFTCGLVPLSLSPLLYPPISYHTQNSIQFSEPTFTNSLSSICGINPKQPYSIADFFKRPLYYLYILFNWSIVSEV